MENKQVQKLVLTATCLKFCTEQMVAISPEDTTKLSVKERCSKMKLLDYIKVTIKATKPPAKPVISKYRYNMPLSLMNRTHSAYIAL